MQLHGDDQDDDWWYFIHHGDHEAVLRENPELDQRPHQLVRCDEFDATSR